VSCSSLQSMSCSCTTLDATGLFILAQWWLLTCTQEDTACCIRSSGPTRVAGTGTASGMALIMYSVLNLQQALQGLTL
jgi:hypothetical protein